MRIPGYCVKCRKIRTVAVSGHALATARGGVVSGVCASCQQADDDRRRDERKR